MEEEAATQELQRMEKEGFFKDYSDDTLCAALVQGNFKKFLQIQLLRDVTYSQFTGEIGRDLKPQLDRTGDDDLWNQFEDYFKDKDLSRNSNLLALIKGNKSPSLPLLQVFYSSEEGLTQSGSVAKQCMITSAAIEPCHMPYYLRD